MVIARECSAEDTRTICENCPVEVEVFAHGALCMCYSGQCEMSALMGVAPATGAAAPSPAACPTGLTPRQKAYPLSLKDSCLAGRLEEMGAMGVSCVKLEGRMKRPEYVAVITRIYARLLRRAVVPPPTSGRSWSRPSPGPASPTGTGRANTALPCSAPVRRTLRTPRTS
ncbi:MAG: U32 family peptidase [Dysosmobacter welbionis]